MPWKILFLAARSYGVGSVWINQMQNINDRPAVRALLDEIGVPADHVIYGVAALGYAGSLRTCGAQGAHRKSRICKIAHKTPPGNAVKRDLNLPVLRRSRRGSLWAPAVCRGMWSLLISLLSITNLNYIYFSNIFPFLSRMVY